MKGGVATPNPPPPPPPPPALPGLPMPSVFKLGVWKFKVVSLCEFPKKNAVIDSTHIATLFQVTNDNAKCNVTDIFLERS